MYSILHTQNELCKYTGIFKIYFIIRYNNIRDLLLIDLKNYIFYKGYLLQIFGERYLTTPLDSNTNFIKYHTYVRIINKFILVQNEWSLIIMY
jgi:hypothetical protein